uniref:Uncharacterized protein n=1 Tax=Anguilla anguilla TaxID=7936 RepID=A0A0E9SDP9_ANGAN
MCCNVVHYKHSYLLPQ